MFAISDPAVEELDAYFEGKEKSPIRVFLAPGGCAGPRLALAMDQPSDEDKVFDEKGYTFCINGELLEAAKTISVEFSDLGFTIRSELNLGASSCGCSGSANSACGGGCSGCGPQ